MSRSSSSRVVVMKESSRSLAGRRDAMIGRAVTMTSWVRMSSALRKSN